MQDACVEGAKEYLYLWWIWSKLMEVKLLMYFVVFSWSQWKEQFFAFSFNSRQSVNKLCLDFNLIIWILYVDAICDHTCLKPHNELKFSEDRSTEWREKNRFYISNIQYFYSSTIRYEPIFEVNIQNILKLMNDWIASYHALYFISSWSELNKKKLIFFDCFFSDQLDRMALFHRFENFFSYQIQINDFSCSSTICSKQTYTRFFLLLIIFPFYYVVQVSISFGCEWKNCSLYGAVCSLLTVEIRLLNIFIINIIVS